MRQVQWLLVCACAAALSLARVPSAEATDYSGVIAQMKLYIEEQMQANQVTGLSIALVDDQTAEWVEGFGYADKEKGIKADGDTVYQIGSVSKTFTALAVMQLVEKGYIDLDRPVTDYVPEFSIKPPLRKGPGPDGQITLRTVLTHHSGIPGDLFNGAFTRGAYPGFMDWLLSYLANDHAAYPANFALAYSNSAYTIMEKVIENVSGQSLKQYADANFQKIGMPNSSYYPDNDFIRNELSKEYYGDTVIENFYVNIPTAGSIYSTANEMAAYLKMIHADGIGSGGPLLLPATLDQMMTVQNASIPLDFTTRIGLCWFLSDSALAYAGRIGWHNGATIIFRTHLEILRDQKLGVLVIANSATAGGAVETIAKQALKLAVKEKAGLVEPTPIPVPYSPPASWTQDRLEALAGSYVHSSGYVLVSAVQGGLQVTSPTGRNSTRGLPIMEEGPRLSRKLRSGSYTLIPRENGWFSPADSQELEVEFSVISGRSVMVIHSGGDTELMGERYVPSGSLSGAWTDRFGSYAVKDLYHADSDLFTPRELELTAQAVVLKEKDGLLLIEKDSGQQRVVEPLSDALGVNRGLGRNLGQSVRIVTVGGREQIRIEGATYGRPGQYPVVNHTEVGSGDLFGLDAVAAEAIIAAFDEYIVMLAHDGSVYSAVFDRVRRGQVRFGYVRGLRKFLANQPPFSGVPVRFRVLEMSIPATLAKGNYTFITAALPAGYSPTSREDAESKALHYGELTVTVR
jgi:CubicO group peptidase (beta-lactamase class C family)